ncbi:DHA2 family efflux MFS transporter permease subunit [Pediococcus argentinicus]|uniref:Major facilitator superfamily (MFS) profile domain-containing protein n=1 Tax=Pediococcus argentinicus TaxID=480391 RepID=A0A0R2NGE8_9LACO|nr:DHA2 family efflux MFS transporter permease subunit [Pediococcus argentinicus]KRO24895.1 hypothetical protein IV88_GL000559 [Pediococcus argentinicus]NKZ22593.1 DHA2 family efflux MFS transporter permease subunit [Pediococcus argentinicus]GEP19747.1 MFS transporter [Pediococcus argentinicus]
MNLKAKLTVMAMGISIFLCMLDTTVMNIALPAIQSGMGVSLETLSWALNIYTITFAVLTIPLGRMADIYGRNRIYLTGLILFGIGSITSGLADSASILIVGRGIQSVGAAVIFPASMTIGISAANLAQRSMIIASLGITQGLASALGPTIGGIVTQFLGWRWVFLVNVPLVLINIVLCLWLLKFKGEQRVNTKIDWLGMILSMITLFSLTLALVKGTDWGWQSPLILGLFGIALVGFIVFILVEQRVSAPMIRLDLFRDRQFDGAAIGILITGVLLVAVMVLMPTFFTKVLGKSELTAAFMITPTSVMIFILAPIAGKLIEIFSPRAIVATGMSLMALGYAFFWIANPHIYWQILVTLILIGAGFGMLAGPIMVLGASDFTNEKLTASQSVLGVLRQIGSVLAVAIFVSALSSNLVAAKNQSKSDAHELISAMKVDESTKAKITYSVNDQISKGDSAKPKANKPLNKEQIKQITDAKYQEVIRKSKPNLPKQSKAAIYGAVQKEVIKKVNQTESEVKSTSDKIKSDVQNNIQKAFIRPYQLTLPFAVLAIGIAFLFKSKKRKA